MCLASPAKVSNLKENGKVAVISLGKKKIEAYNLAKAKKGDWVLVQQGVAVEKMSKENAKASVNAWKKSV